MSRRQRAGRRVHGIVAVLLGLAAMLASLWSATPARALPVPEAFTCAGIPVVVDYAALGGGATVGCATTYTNGTTALRSAGYTVYLDAGMITKINGLPTAPNTAQNYWSYWHATRQADGSYSGWSYSSLGANAFQPGPNDAEGWRYEPTSGGYVPPSVLPPKQTTTQAPATTAPAPATTAKTTTAPKTTAVAPATTGSTSAAPATSASQPVSDSPTPSASDSPSPSDTPADTPTSSPEASSSASAASGRGGATSSLLGGLGAIGVIAAGAGGVLWWRKRALTGG